MDQDGRFADGIRRILDGLSDCFAIGQIAFEQPRVLIFLGQVLDIEHGYSGALGGKGRRDKPPNAPASAGKDYVLSVDAHFEPILPWRSEEHKTELQSIMRILYAVYCLKKNKHSQ